MREIVRSLSLGESNLASACYWLSEEIVGYCDRIEGGFEKMAEDEGVGDSSNVEKMRLLVSNRLEPNNVHWISKVKELNDIQKFERFLWDLAAVPLTDYYATAKCMARDCTMYHRNAVYGVAMMGAETSLKSFYTCTEKFLQEQEEEKKAESKKRKMEDEEQKKKKKKKRPLVKIAPLVPENEKQDSPVD